METRIIYLWNIFHGFNIKLHLFYWASRWRGSNRFGHFGNAVFGQSFNCFFAALTYLIPKVWSSRNQKENYVFTKGWSFLVRNHYLQRAVNQSIACVTPYRLPAISFLSDTIFWPYSLFVFVISPSIFLGIIQCNSVQCTLTFCLLLLLCVKAELGNEGRKLSNH